MNSCIITNCTKYYKAGRARCIKNWQERVQAFWLQSCCAVLSAGQTGAMVTGWLTDPSDGHSYYPDIAPGAMVTGEKAMNVKKYFFNEYPAGATGWHFDEASQRWHFDGGIVIPMGALLREE